MCVGLQAPERCHCVADWGGKTVCKTRRHSVPVRTGVLQLRCGLRAATGLPLAIGWWWQPRALVAIAEW